MNLQTAFVHNFSYQGILNLLKCSSSFADFQQELRNHSSILWGRNEVIELLQKLQNNKNTKVIVLDEIERLKATDGLTETGEIKEDTSIDIDIRLNNLQW